MAETLTVDTTPQTETVVDESGSLEGLTPDEQDSLQVGEQIQEQQESLLAGKYENAEQLEKAYIELQKKLGQDEKEETPQAENEQEEVLQETSEEEPSQPSEAAELITSASDEYYNNDNKLSPETVEKLSKLSSEDLIKAYMEVQSNLPVSLEDTSADISDSVVNEVKNFAGGEQAYQQMVDWASTNLENEDIAAFDSIINSGSVQAIKLAVNGLKSQYTEAMGNDGELLTGKAPVNQRDVYRSQAELVAAMSDRRYDNDPAYRQDVIAKLERSDNLQF
tara:strand:- start:14 stop:850 length:837 start_codon:yes stop_codon:yes gene_type:complete